MTQQPSTRALLSLARWIDRSIQNAVPGADSVRMPIIQLSTWRDAIIKSAVTIEERERLVVKAEAAQAELSAGDRIDQAYAQRCMEDAAKALKRLAQFAVNSADGQQTIRRIQIDAQTLLDSLEALALGIDRPKSPSQTPDIGA